MSDKVQYSILGYLDLEGAKPSGFEVHVEAATRSDVDAFSKAVINWLWKFNNLKVERPGYPAEKRHPAYYTVRISAPQNGTPAIPEEKPPFYCSEEEVLYSLLYASKGISVDFKTIKYKDCSYTDFSNKLPLDEVHLLASDNPNLLPETHIAQPVCLSAKRQEGRDVDFFFFGPYLYSGEEEKWRDEICSYPLSHGIVITEKGTLYYAGTLRLRVIKEEKEGRKFVRYGYAENAHVFFEQQGGKIAFSLLLGGERYDTISKNHEKLTFYHRPFEMARDFTLANPRGKENWDIIFQKSEGQYRYVPDSRYRFIGVSSSAFPEIPDSIEPDSLNKLNRLYKAYVTAFYNAFFDTKEYKTSDWHFCKGENKIYRSNIKEGFTLEAKFDRNPSQVFSGEWAFGMDTPVLYQSDNYFFLERVTFEAGDMSISLIPMGSNLKIEIAKDAAQETLLCGTFNELRQCGFFLPRINANQTFDFSRNIAAVKTNLCVYQKIKDTIRDDVQKFISSLERIEKRKQEISRNDMEKDLYKKPGEIPDKGLVAFACELKSHFARTGKILDIAIFGEAGTGKSTVAGQIAEVLGKAGVEALLPSSLKGTYVGHTKVSVYNAVKNAAEENKIVFIDEAYELMSDQFGREAVSILLILMTGNWPADEVVEWNKEKKSLRWKAEIKEIPPIWIAGYEDEVRLMMQENQGLFRRLRKVSLTPPTTTELYQELIGKLEGALEDPDFFQYSPEKKDAMETKFTNLIAAFKNNEKMIKDFFQWGAQRQNSKYFAHHAGVDRFIHQCLDRINWGDLGTITSQIEDIIALTKRDIKSQLHTVKSAAESKPNGSHGNLHLHALDGVNMLFDIETRFKDLVGCDSQVAYMRSILKLILRKGEYERMNITVPKGALLVGAPGVGKTFIARAMAGELQDMFQKEHPDKRACFMSLSASELIAKEPSFIGSIFDAAEKSDVCIIFIDEVDAIARNRFINDKNYSHLTELIKQMDGAEQRSNIFVLAATNAPESLDPAFTRSGRIDKRLEFYLPDENARRELVRRNIESRCTALANFDNNDSNEDDIDTLAKKFAKITPECTPGDIANIINDAFVMHVQERDAKKNTETRKSNEFGNVVWAMADSDKSGLGKSEIQSDELRCLSRHLYEAFERHTIGELRPATKEENTFSPDKNDMSRSSTAIHEVGHAMVNILTGGSFEMITSLPRGNALGYVRPNPKNLVTKKDFEDDIRVTMGGRAAEEIVYGKDNISVGASQDMRHATHHARLMVEKCGFAEELGFMALSEDTARYLGKDGYTCSKSFREKSDQAASVLLKKLYQETMGMLADKKELIIKLAEQVFDQKVMTGEEFKKRYNENLKSTMTT